MNRSLQILCAVMLYAVAAFGEGPAKHLDPPGPPQVEEFVYLYEVTLTDDEDDGILFFDGDTEILITTTINKPGHEYQTWTRLIDDIDMDPPVEDEYRVLNGDEENFRPEQKGGKAKIFSHFECSPAASMNLDIEIYEVNSFGIGDVLEVLGKAAGALTKSGLLDGYLWVGEAGKKVGELLDGVGEEEDSLGTDSGVVPLGISPVKMPTIKYRYRTEYISIVTNSLHCGDDDREESWRRENDPELEEWERELFKSRGRGFDEKHPFTTSPNDVFSRAIHLDDALQKVDQIGVRDGEPAPDIETIQDLLRTAISDIACDAIETEINEAFATPEDPPDVVWDAFFAWEDGVTLALADDHAAAVDSCMTFLDELVELNHPEIFYNDFNAGDSLGWSKAIGEATPGD